MKSLLLSLLLVPALAMAADDAKPKKPGKGGKQPNQESVFKRLDSNADGALSLDEFKASPRGQKNADKAEAHYKKMDKDSDSKVTLDEFKSRASRKAGKKARRTKPEAPKSEVPVPGTPKKEV